MRSRNVAMSALVLSLVLPGGPAGAQQTASVDVVDSAFQPEGVTVDAGGTVTWSQSGSLPHSVTADDGSFDSHPDCGDGDCMGAGDTFAHTFDEPGTYAYYCRVHGAPGGVGMAGTVTVAAAAEAPTSTPTTEPTSDPAPDSGDAEVSGSMDVADQTGDGTSVTVRSVTISGADGFVVIHLDEDGQPGRVLGHVAIDEGTSSDVVVRLDEALTADTTVWPMLHVDAGVLGTYEFPGPDGPVMAAGAVVMAPLELTIGTADDDGGTLPLTGAPALVLLALALALGGAGSVAARRGRAGER